jgi:hypothetical protein
LIARSRQTFNFSHHLSRLLVAPNSGEARKTQSIVRRPLQKLDPSDYERIQPPARHHFRGREFHYTRKPAAEIAWESHQLAEADVCRALGIPERSCSLHPYDPARTNL